MKNKTLYSFLMNYPKVINIGLSALLAVVLAILVLTWQ